MIPPFRETEASTLCLSDRFHLCGTKRDRGCDHRSWLRPLHTDETLLLPSRRDDGTLLQLLGYFIPCGDVQVETM